LSTIPDKSLITDVALETGIDPAFIEKDWYAVQLLQLLSAFQREDEVKLVFSGGTSLSKAYDLIKRFSEDLDFILTSPPEISRGERREFRKALTRFLDNDERFSINDIQVRNSSKFFQVIIEYDKLFAHSSLRPHLRLEMSFSTTKLPPQDSNIHSMIGAFMGLEPETRLRCISPIETAADKLSALTWRVLIRDRKDSNDDPTIIRHLHDLCALKDLIDENQQSFLEAALKSLKVDAIERGRGQIKTISISDRLDSAYSLLKDPLYRKEYQDFALGMSYAKDSEKLVFDKALKVLKDMISMFKV